MAPPLGYDAFISYSHVADDRLAQEMQHALQQFGKRFYQRRSLNIFRDQTDLTVNPSLWSRIEAALDQARYFLLFASPRAAGSVWVKREIDHWLARHNDRPENLLILWTDGRVVWPDGGTDFDWTATNALPKLLDWNPRAATPPRTLEGAFAGSVPMFVDLRWTREQRALSVRDPRFLDHVATIAAEIHGVPKRDLIGRDVVEHKRLRRWGYSLATALVVLAIAAVGFGIRAQRNAAEASRQAGIAKTNEAEAIRQQGIAKTNEAEAVRQQGIAKTNEAEAVRQQGIAHVNEVEAQKQAKLARQRQREAEAAAATALSRQLAAQSMEAAPRQLDLGLLLALAAGDTADTQQSRVALFDSLQKAGHVWSYLGPTERGRLFSAVAISPDGSLVIAGNTDGRLLPFDSAHGRPAGEPVAAHDFIDSLAVDRTRSWLFTAGRDRRIGIRRLPSLDLLGSVPIDAASVPALTVSPDGAWLAAAAGGVRLLNINTRTWSAPIGKRQDRYVQAVAFNPDPRFLAFAYDDGEIDVWNAASNTLLPPMRGHDTPYIRQSGNKVETRTDAAVDALAFSPDGTRLATGGYDGRVVIWDWQHGVQVAATSPKTASPIGTVAFSPDGATVYAGTWTGEMQVWNARNGRSAAPPAAAHQGRIVASAQGPDGRIVTAGWDGLLVQWDFGHWPTLQHLCPPQPADESGRWAFAVSRTEMVNGSYVVASSQKHPLVIWDLARPSLAPRTLVTEGVKTFAVAGSNVVYVDERGHVKVLDVRDTEAKAVTIADLGRAMTVIGDCRAAADGTHVYIADRRGHLADVDLRLQRATMRTAPVAEHADDVSISKDGRRIASRAEQEIVVGDITGKTLLRKTGGAGRVVLSADGRLVAVNRYQFTDLLDVDSGKLLHTLDHTERGVSMSLTFSPDGRVLVSRGGDQRITFWDTESGFQTLQFRNPVAFGSGGATFTRDMKRFLEGHSDGSVSVWDIDPTSWRRTAMRIANRILTSAERERYGVASATAPARP